MLKLIDNFLNKTTMYRLVLYYLLFLIAAALILGYFSLIPYSPAALFVSATFIVAVCWVTNFVFAKIFGAVVNIESIYITALILALIIAPMPSLTDFQYFSLAFWASVLAIASKFIFAIKKKHIFNPAAIAVVLTAIVLNLSASWWVGTLAILPFVLAGGLILVRKIQRFDLVLSFLAVSILTILTSSIFRGSDIFISIKTATLYSPIFFFAFVMLTEPLTTPPTKPLRILYGALVGFIFAPAMHIGNIYSTPELSLIVGNIFSYLVSPKKKLILKLNQRIKTSPDIFDFIFTPDQELNFKPGQYLEWTLGHAGSDSRGNRRYFTIASSPTEQEIRIGVKFYQKSSSFKKALLFMEPGDQIIASQLAGDFTLPKNKTQKLVFMAGGIGITPFRSMLKSLLDNNEKRSIVLFYSNKNASEIVYKDIFDQAEQRLGIKTIYAITDSNIADAGSKIINGRITGGAIMKEAPDYMRRIFYLSGPHSMVTAFEDILVKMGVKKSQIKKDFFPGLV